MQIDLSKKYNIRGTEIEKIDIKFEEMTGREFLACEAEYKQHSKGAITLKEWEDKYALTVAAKASGLRFSDFQDFAAVDYMKVLNQTKLFLNKGWESEEDKKEEELLEESAEV